MIKAPLTAASIVAVGLALSACTDADVASNNLSKAADNFEIMRRIVVVNGITGGYELEVVGLCSLGNNDTPLMASITCKTGPRDYKKHILRRSDNVFIVAEQLEGAEVNVYHYRVTFKPQGILPDIDFRGSTDELLRQ